MDGVAVRMSRENKMSIKEQMVNRPGQAFKGVPCGKGIPERTRRQSRLDELSTGLMTAFPSHMVLCPSVSVAHSYSKSKTMKQDTSDVTPRF